MKILIHIARFKILSFLKQSFELKVKNIFRNLASAIIFGGFALGAFYATRVGTDYLLDTAKLGSFLLHRFLSMILFVYFVSINVGNIIVSYATFYRSSEVQYYMTKPVSHTELFLIKFFDNFFYSSSAFFIIAFAVLLGYGSHFHMDWLFYLRTLFLMLIPFMLIAGCLAVILILFLVRYAGRIGVKKLVALLTMLYIGFLTGYFTITSPLKLVARILQHYPNLDQYFGYLDHWMTKYLPNYWIAESLYWTMKGDHALAFSYTILILITTIILFCAMVLVGKKIFFTSWLASLEFSASGNTKREKPRVFSLERKSKINLQSSVLLKKEFWQFVREPSQWIHSGIITLLVLLFMVSISNINLKQNMPFLQTVSYMVVLLFNSFLIVSIALRFIYPSMSIEGPNFWSVLSSPVKRNKIFMLKYWIWFVPVLLLSELLVLFSHRSLMEFPVLVNSAALLTASVAFISVSMNLGMGSYFADFKEKNPIRIASSQNATLIFLLSIIYLTLLVASTFIPLNGFFAYMLKGVPFELNSLFISTASFILVSGVVGSFFLITGIRTMRRDY
ncbi:MAG: hypothetical protein HZB59_00185 [Ignavibacteriales bacterium]|nr:hypothetical protein [Ignavibacteriales bacterium]